MRNTVGWFRALGTRLLRLPRGLAGIAALGWAGVIWWTSSHSPPPAPRRYDWRAVAQNFLHAPAFGVLALLCVLLYRRGPGWPRPTRLERALVLVTVAAYGVVDELHQSAVPGRDLSVLDLATDVTGAACVLWIIAYLGTPEASEAGLARRFGLGLCACLASAACATWLPWVLPGIEWF